MLLFISVLITLRSSPWKCSVKKDVLENFANFTEKHKEILTQVFHGCSPVYLIRIFRTTFYKNTSGGLRLSSPANFVNIGEIQPSDRVDLLLSKQIKYRCAWIYFRCVKEAELKILYIKSKVWRPPAKRKTKDKNSKTKS